MNIRTPEGFGKLNARERVVASAAFDILRHLENIDPTMLDTVRSGIMDDIEANVIKLAKLFY